MVTFIHKVKFLCVSSIGVLLLIRLSEFMCALMLSCCSYFLPGSCGIFVCLFVSSKNHEILFLGTGVVAFALVMFSLSPHHISSTFSQRISEVDVTFPLQSFNQRHWIRGTAVVAERGILGMQRESPQQLGSVLLAVAFAAPAAAMGQREVMFQWTWIPDQ